MMKPLSLWWGLGLASLIVLAATQAFAADDSATDLTVQEVSEDLHPSNGPPSLGTVQVNKRSPYHKEIARRFLAGEQTADTESEYHLPLAPKLAKRATNAESRNRLAAIVKSEERHELPTPEGLANGARTTQALVKLSRQEHLERCEGIAKRVPQLMTVSRVAYNEAAGVCVGYNERSERLTF